MTYRYKRFKLVQYLRYTFDVPAKLVFIGYFNFTLAAFGLCYGVGLFRTAWNWVYAYFIVLLLHCVASLYYFIKYKRYGLPQ